MNTNNIYPTTMYRVGSFHILIDTFLNTLIYLAGVAVTIWAYRRSRKCGYLILSVYFAIALFSLLALPPINRAIRASRPADLSKEASLKIANAIQQDTDRILAEAGHPVIVAHETIHLPFGSIILVAGLGLLARRETSPAIASPESTNRSP